MIAFMCVRICGRHGDVAAHATRGNDQINVTVANEAAPVPRRSASSVLTSCRTPAHANERRHTHTYTHVYIHTQYEENTLKHDTHGYKRNGSHFARFSYFSCMCETLEELTPSPQE